MDNFQGKISSYLQQLYDHAPRLVGAIVVLLIGLWVIKWITKLLSRYFERSKLDPSVRPFLRSLVSILLKVMLIFSVAEIVGIKTASFVAVLAAAGFAIGMALQGSLGNFAAGVMILIFKPYRVGDLIDVQGQLGHVKEIQIFNTIMVTLDNKTTIIPNSVAISDVVVNLTTEPWLRVDLNVYMPYDEDYDKVEGIILEALKSTPKVLQDPAPYVGIEDWGSHNIKLAVRPHSTCEDYWDVYFGAYRSVTKALSNAGIQMAYSEGVEMGPIGRKG